MPRSRGQIRKRGEDKYLVRIYLGRIDGKRKYKSKVVHGDKEAAEKRLTEMLHRKDQGLVSHALDTKLAEVLDESLETKETKGAPGHLQQLREGEPALHPSDARPPETLPDQLPAPAELHQRAGAKN